MAHRYYYREIEAVQADTVFEIVNEGIGAGIDEALILGFFLRNNNKKTAAFISYSEAEIEKRLRQSENPYILSVYGVILKLGADPDNTNFCII